MNRFRKRDNSGTTALLIVGSVVGVLFLLLLACGGVVFFVVYKAGQAIGPQLQQQAQNMEADTAVQVFLNDLSLGRIDAAYQGTTPAFRARRTLPQFKAFVAQNPLLTKFTDCQQAAVNPNQAGGRMTLHYTLIGEGVTPLTFQLVKVGEEWQVDDVTVP